MSLTRKRHTHLHASLHHNTDNSALCYIRGGRKSKRIHGGNDKRLEP